MRKFSNTDEIRVIVDGFESCRTGKDSFKHQDHLVVAVSYLRELTVADAASKMRTNLLRFIDHHQIDPQKYNETITVFWLEVVAELLSKLRSDSTLVENCNAVMESLNNAGLVFDYYSRERLFSDEARETFIRPDLKDWDESDFDWRT